MKNLAKIVFCFTLFSLIFSCEKSKDNAVKNGEEITILIQPFEDGQDSSDVFSVSNLEYLGSSFDQKYDIAFYYKCTIKDVGFGSSVNRIFKVINYKNNYYIDGIYNEF